MNTNTTNQAVTTFQHILGRGWTIPTLPTHLDSVNTLVLAFCSPAYLDQADALVELYRAFPTSLIAGCSTSGEIVGDRMLDNSISIAVCRFEHTKLSFASAPVRSAADSRSAGLALAAQMPTQDLKAVFVLSDGLRVNGSELIRGLDEGLPPGVVVSGGLAGDGSRFQKTWVLRNGAPVSGFITAVGFCSTSLTVSHGSRGGWDQFGVERSVTRSDGNILYELDGRPALELYKEYLGERAAGLPATALLFPLAIRTPQDPGNQLVRTVLTVDEATQSLTFAGDIPQGASAQLMRSNPDRLVDAAGQATHDAHGDTAALTIAISCVGRRLVLGARAEDELEAARDALTPGSALVGFYSYGELSPSGLLRCDLHNQTMTVTTFREA